MCLKLLSPQSLYLEIWLTNTIKNQIAIPPVKYLLLRCKESANKKSKKKGIVYWVLTEECVAWWLSGVLAIRRWRWGHWSLSIRQSEFTKFHNTMRFPSETLHSSKKTEKRERELYEERNMTSHNQATKLKVIPNDWKNVNRVSAI